MREKLIIPNFLAVLLLGVGSLLFLRESLRKDAKEQLKEKMTIVSDLFIRSEGLHGYELLTSVRTEALSRQMVQVFAPVTVDAEAGLPEADVDTRVRQAWFVKASEAIHGYVSNWQQAGRDLPDLVLLTDRAGVVVSRNITPNACPTGVDVSKAIPIVARALDGEASFAVWSVEDSPFSPQKMEKSFCQLMNTGLMEIAAAPVWYGEDIGGVLLIGFEISNGAASSHAEKLGLDIAVLKNGKVYSSSLQTDTARQSLERKLAESGVKSRISSTVERLMISDVFEISVEGESFFAIALPNVHAARKDKVVTIILGSHDAACAYLSVVGVIFVFMGISLLVVFVSGSVLANHFMKPVMQLEEGVLKVINGDVGHRFDIKSSELGGLGYRINQMIGSLVGEDEDGDDDE